MVEHHYNYRRHFHEVLDATKCDQLKSQAVEQNLPESFVKITILFETTNLQTILLS